MKALLLTATDGPQCAQLRELPKPLPAAGEVSVALKAAALNHREIWISRGQYPGMVPAPFVLGCDGAGVIDAVGEGVDPRRIGEAVVIYPGLGWGGDRRFPQPAFGLLGMPGPGTVAEAICVPAASAVAKPEYLDFNQAAAVPLAALTAWRGLFTKAGIKAGERVLITGVGGGVATFALQFAVQAGAEVFVTSGSEQTLARAVQLGARVGFNYKDEGWKKALAKSATNGIDVVFDGAPAGSYACYGRALAMGARVVVYGSTGGLQFPVNAPELFLKNVSIVGTNVGDEQDFVEMLAFVGQHAVAPVIDKIFPLSAAADALLYLQDAHQFGKVVVSISG